MLWRHHFTTHSHLRFFFCGSRPIREKCEILHRAKISCCVVTTDEVTSTTIAHLLCAVCLPKEKRSRGEWQLDYWPLRLSKSRKKKRSWAFFGGNCLAFSCLVDIWLTRTQEVLEWILRYMVTLWTGFVFIYEQLGNLQSIWTEAGKFVANKATMGSNRPGTSYRM